MDVNAKGLNYCLKNFYLKKPHEVHCDYYKYQEKFQDHENNPLNQKQDQEYSVLVHTKLQNHLKYNKK